MEAHKAARMAHAPWPGRDALQKATKGGQFALHSQSVQMVVGAFLANIKSTQELRQTHPQLRMKYPWRTKHFYPVKWPEQAVSCEHRQVVLPMGKGHPSLVLPLDLPANSGACSLVWNHGFELHVCVDRPQAEEAPGTARATVDLGEIHLAAVTTNTGQAMIVTGRGIRSLKHQRSKQLGKMGKEQSRCVKYSRRWKKLQRAKAKQCRRAKRRIRDMRHKATRKVIDFCVVCLDLLYAPLANPDAQFSKPSRIRGEGALRQRIFLKFHPRDGSPSSSRPTWSPESPGYAYVRGTGIAPDNGPERVEDRANGAERVWIRSVWSVPSDPAFIGRRERLNTKYATTLV